MFGSTNPKERFGFVAISALLVGFFGYVGAQQIHPAPAPLVLKTESSRPSTDKAPRKSTSEANPDRKSPQVVVHIVGAVKNPGVYTLNSDMHLIDAVKAAGGFLHANQQRPNLAARLVDGTQYVIPPEESKGHFRDLSGNQPVQVYAESLPAPGGGDAPTTTTKGTKKGKSPAEPVDLNSATSEQLQTIPGIGPATAERILNYRTEHGSFTSVDELTSVGGIGVKKLEKMRSWLHV